MADEVISWSCFVLAIERSDIKGGIYFVRKSMKIFLIELSRSMEIMCSILIKFVYPWICNRSAELNVFGVEEIALASMHVRDLEVTLQCSTGLSFC